MFGQPQGLQALLKDGAKQFTGIDEALLKNIEAVRNLSEITRTSLGPNSMQKLIINHIEKHYVTSNAAKMVSELEVMHPAAKLVVGAASMQEQEFGNATNFVVTFAGELLTQAEALCKMGLHTADIIKGFERALATVEETLPGLTCWSLTDLKDTKQVQKAVKPAIAAKQYGLETELSALVAEAVTKVMPSDPKKFDVDNVRVAKINGSSLSNSFVVEGMVVGRPPSGTEQQKLNCKVLVLGCGLEMTGTETKGTVLLHNAEELLNFTKGEENKMEEVIKEIKDTGVEVIVSHGNIAEIAQHFCNKYKILTIKIQSKFELRRICRTLGATALVRLGAPLPEEMGTAESVEVVEMASQKATVLKAKDTKVSTIVLRGASSNALEEVERAIDNAIQTVRAGTKDSKFVPGAGASEIELALVLRKTGVMETGLDQYAVLKFGEALECVPKILAENAGFRATDTVTELYAAHQAGGLKTAGVDVDGGQPFGSSPERDAALKPVAEARSRAGAAVAASDDTASHVICSATLGVVDHMQTKLWAIKLSTDAVLTVLRVDQIIMSKPAGGPKPKEGGPGDDDD
uniref:CCT-theta n=1 Tax=Chromera velia CCMP2878 TaxID=1169474 RepID=A0A0G4FZU3_9ALVE|mmetsp:Transcript_4251/g.8646  ORF Transcript_4251/g.8646 Transcript_4251/m.8646 type:complete len:576 (+) Transcript_4251:293-2020(+)|eukprot:Cvel_19423.t1-p1 / transcript=Cvel_19423.t1 / gene=Cvel_19423 / organism=Chromera_velia_CCMP2878 / gene_product=Probable T-complex protein 1 subunit theta, putative / transcript_product=Probable T-complex protein 1 subunit theta, putative / location=Cvel_scaffold1673:12825-19856(-) / protein_length=575 / sequence_SO=supercontig / SO=protein_coding / is_pseudo=false